jgi:hypothetical protein
VPEGVVALGDTMAGYPGVWALCGGWAVDAWLGRVTREHGDVDLAVFADDYRLLFEHLDGWQMLAHDATWEPNDIDVWWDGSRRVGVPGHIHARPPERSGVVPKDGIAHVKDGFWLDIQICESDAGEWLMQREPRISAALAESIRMSPWGVPTAVPEVLLFYKAHEPRQRDRRDFDALAPSLEGEQRLWLREAIERAEHPWVARLSD